MARETLILFDLDGTLTDPKPGITGSIQYALERMGEEVPHADELEWTIGPPLQLNFVKLVGEDRADEGVRLYRERFGETGLFENRLIDGIPALLESLHAQGHKMVVATSKPHVFASRIVTHFGLDPFLPRSMDRNLTAPASISAICCAISAHRKIFVPTAPS